MNQIDQVSVHSGPSEYAISVVHIQSNKEVIRGGDSLGNHF